MLVSAGARGVILQHAPARPCFKGHPGFAIPRLDEELQLIALYGARVLAITLNGDGMSAGDLREAQRTLAARLAVPVIRPLEEGVEALVPLCRQYIETETGGR
jgi:uncharacterized NAD-dependent epimerase/dehydratase family protein